MCMCRKCTRLYQAATSVRSVHVKQRNQSKRDKTIASTHLVLASLFESMLVFASLLLVSRSHLDLSTADLDILSVSSRFHQPRSALMGFDRLNIKHREEISYRRASPLKGTDWFFP